MWRQVSTIVRLTSKLKYHYTLFLCGFKVDHSPCSVPLQPHRARFAKRLPFLSLQSRALIWRFRGDLGHDIKLESIDNLSNNTHIVALFVHIYKQSSFLTGFIKRVLQLTSEMSFANVKSLPFIAFCCQLSHICPQTFAFHRQNILRFLQLRNFNFLFFYNTRQA